MSDGEIEEKLDAIISLLALEKDEELEEMLEDLDDIQKEILSRTSEWRKSSDLKPKVIEAKDSSDPTVKRKLKDLKEKGLIMKKGKGTATKYKSKPVINQVQKLSSELR